MAAPHDPASRRDFPQAARRAVERATAEQHRIRESVKDTVADTVGPVVRHRPIRVLRRTLAKAWRDRVLGLSAEAAFWQLLSMPPLFLALLGSLGYIGGLFGPTTVHSVETRLISSIERVLTPNVVQQLVVPTVHGVLQHGRADVISIGFVLALWAGSSATATFVNTITIAYGMRDMRGAIRSRLIALWIYLVSVLIGVLLLPVLVLGPAKIVDFAPGRIRGDVATFVNALYWPVVVVILMIGLTSLYHLALPKRLPWHRGIPGAVFAGCIFLLGSYGLRIYIDSVVRRAYLYGALASPIAALLFLFLLALAVLLGAEFNAAIEEMWPSRPSGHTRRAARRRAKAAATRRQ
ncbi:MAG TPA: YihY/virulence factor BrkB family protein [Mycobacteriales bacterium]